MERRGFNNEVQPVDVDDIEQHVEPGGRVIFRASLRSSLQRQFPVRLAVFGLNQANFRVVDIDQLNEKWPVKYRPKIDAYFDTTDFNHVRFIIPVGVLKTNVFSDDHSVPGEIDLELPVNHKFATGFLANPAFNLRLEHTQICRPQPGQGKCQQRDKYHGGPESDSFDCHKLLVLEARWPLLDWALLDSTMDRL